jgi:hypothetical protein
LDEYESKFLQEKCVLSSEKYNLILECLNAEKGIKAPGGARFKHWVEAQLQMDFSKGVSPQTFLFF